MKKRISLLLVLALVLTAFAGCAKTDPAAEETQTAETAVTADNETEATETETDTQAAETPVRLAGLKGPTSIGLVRLLEENAGAYDFTVAGSADEITPKLVKGELDIAAVPSNLGAVLYNKTNGGVKMLAVCTLGVLYIVEKGGESINSIADLKGKTLYSTGKGSTPEYVLTYLLQQNGLTIGTDVTVEWKSEPTETLASMANEDEAVAVVPQPYVTTALQQMPDLRVAVDLSEEWDALDNGSRCITACIVVRTAFAQEHPEQTERFLQSFAESVQYVNENTEDSAALCETYGIVKADIAEKAIPDCNIVCITGEEMKTAAEGYLGILYSQNPESVGGSLPGEDFYY